jgi:DNA-binding NarL/FixJ family response regulator
MSMGDTSGLTITRTIRERNSKTSIIAITSFPIHNYAAKAADAGAQAIASKGDPTDIALTINKVSTLGVWNSVDNTLFEPAAKAYGRVSNSMSSRKGTLTARENTIITLCSQGKTSIEIAEELNISPKTVNTHFQRISDKLGARNRVQLVAIWMEYRHQYHEGA